MFKTNNFSRTTNALLLGFAALLVYSIGSTLSSVQQSIQSEREKVAGKAALLAEHIDYELDYLINGVKTMQNIADRYLAGRVHEAVNPVGHLKALADKQVYVTELPINDPALPQAKRGRITGPLPVPDSADSIVKEMQMAIGMSPVMQALRAHMPDIPWIYYTSAQRFMYLFPESEAQDFYFTDALMDLQFIAGATPQANPKRQVFWTHPYTDEAGKGLMVTVSQPIYQGDDFKGAVSIDMSVARLQSLLNMHPIVGARVDLLSEDNQLLASKTDADRLGNGEVSLKLPLQNAPWRLQLSIDNGSLLLFAMKNRAAQIAGAVILSISFVFMWLLARSAQRIRELSIRDGLTGLHNRRYFDSVVGLQFDGARRGNLAVGLAILDVDFFKKYNDSYGHQQGDHALQAVARALRSALQRGSDQVFRIGGEEFAVITQLKGDETLEPLLARINQAVRDLQMPHVGNPPGYMTISIGAVVVDAAHWITPADAYKQADAALYQAKSTGRDRFVCVKASLESAAQIASP